MADRPCLFGGIDMIINNSESQVPEIIDLFPQTKKEKSIRSGYLCPPTRPPVHSEFWDQ